MADDEPAIRAAIGHLLKQQRYRVLEAENGLKGLELAKKEIPDLMLVDLTLPKMEGWEMVRRIKADPQTAHVPVIVVSARRPQDEEHEHRTEEGVGVRA